MRVDSSNELTRATKIQVPTRPRKLAAEPNQVDLAKTDALGAALKATPEARPDQVARAKALIQDPGYPSAKVVQQVAGVLAKRIRGNES